MLRKHRNLYMSYINKHSDVYSCISLSTIRELIRFTINRYNISYNLELEDILMQDFVNRYVESIEEDIFKLHKVKCQLLATIESNKDCKEYFIEDELDSELYYKLFIKQLFMFYSEDIKTKEILEIYIITKTGLNKKCDTVKVTLKDDIKIISFSRNLHDDDFIEVRKDIEKYYNIPINLEDILIDRSYINEIVLYLDTKVITFYKFTIYLKNVSYPLFYIKRENDIVRMNITLNDINHAIGYENVDIGNLKFCLDYNISALCISTDKHIFKIDLKKYFTPSILEVMNRIF